MQKIELTGFKNEAEVEQKLIYPLLVSPLYLNIPSVAVRPKEYLAPTALDKRANKKTGYFPDYSIWMYGDPVLIVEAKDPEISAEQGFREACLYARHLNTRYATKQNPCAFVISTNGLKFLAGYWDQETPVVDAEVNDLTIGSSSYQRLLELCSFSIIDAHAKRELAKWQKPKGLQPFGLVANGALINSKLPLNHFAAPLSPMLRRYFSSSTAENVKEIAEKAYVSSSEITEYDRILEALLKDRGSPKRDSIVEPLQVKKKEEPALSKALGSFLNQSQRAGHLQIIQGAVGSGKSLFARRYRDLLQPDFLRENTIWAFIDFNGSPPSLKGAEKWLCEALVQSIENENSAFDLYAEKTLKGIFSRKIQQRRAYYAQLREISDAEEIRARANDIVTWQSDPIAFAEVTSPHRVVQLQC